MHYITEGEATRLAERALALVVFTLPTLDGESRRRLGEAFARQYAHILNSAQDACPHCGGMRLRSFTGSNPTGVPGETWTDDAYRCVDCSAVCDEPEAVFSLHAIEFRVDRGLEQAAQIIERLMNESVFDGIDGRGGSAQGWTKLRNARRYLAGGAR